MLSLDDIIGDTGEITTTSSNQSNKDLYKDVFVDRGVFSNISLSYPVIYNARIKKFIPGNSLTNKNNAFLGWLIGYDDNTQYVDVLYRGFLFKDPVKIPINLQQQFVQCYVWDQFKLAANSIIENMPRIKKLKRLNLKMVSKTYALFIYKNLDKLIRQYEVMYGYENAQLLKAQIVTSPFYINDNGVIKIYDIQTNELTTPELESEAYFLAYFTFLNK